MKSIIKTTLAIFLALLSSTSFAQEIIELCPEDNHKIQMDHMKTVEWYAKEWNDSIFRYKATSPTLDLDALYPNRTLSKLQVYSIEQLEDCSVTISDTLEIVPRGFFTPEMMDTAIIISRSTFINDTSTFIVRPEYSELLDPNAAGSPDSIYFSFPVLAGRKGEEFTLTQKITSDTLQFIIPPASIIHAENQIDFSSSLAIMGNWGDCELTDVLNLPEFIWDESNYIVEAKENDQPNGLYFFASGLIDKMYAGENPENLIGMVNTSSDTLKQLEYEILYTSNDPALSTAATRLSSNDSIKIAPAGVRYIGIDDEADYPLELATAEYNVNILAINGATLTGLIESSRPYEFVNDLDFAPQAELKLIDKKYMGDPLHNMEMTLSSSPFRSFYQTELRYFFLSEDKQDTSVLGFVPVPYLEAGSANTFEMDMITGDRTYQYDTVYMNLTTVEGHPIASYTFPTMLESFYVQPKNGLVSQDIAELVGYNQIFVGDTLVNWVGAGENHVTNKIDYDWGKAFYNLPAESSVGKIETYYNEPLMNLNFSLYYKVTDYYKNQSQNDERELVLKDTLHIQHRLVFDYYYITNSGTQARSAILDSSEKDTIVSYEDKKSFMLKFNSNLDGSKYFEFINRPDNVFKIENGNIYQQTVISYKNSSPTDFSSPSSLSDTLRFNMYTKGTFINDIDFDLIGLESSPYTPGEPTKYLWSDYGWNAVNKRFDVELNQEVYDLRANITRSKLPTDFDYSGLEVGIYRATAAWDSLRYQRAGNRNFAYWIGFGDNNREGKNQVHQDIYKVDSLMTLYTIKPITELMDDNFATSGNFTITVPYEADRPNFVVVLDPNNKFREYNEMNNMKTNNPFLNVKSGVLLRLAKDSTKTIDANTTERISAITFEYRGKTYDAFYATDNNHYGSSSGGFLYNPDVPETFQLNPAEKVKFNFQIENIGNHVSSGKAKLVVSATDIPQNEYLDFKTTLVDTIDITTPILPQNGERSNTITTSIEFVPADYFYSNRGLLLSAYLIYDEYENSSSTEKENIKNKLGTSGNLPHRVGAYFSRMVVQSPDLILENIIFPQDTVVNCGDDFPIEINLFNNSNKSALNETFYLNVKDNYGYEEVIPVEGIGIKERKTVTFHKNFRRSLTSGNIQNYQIEVELDVDDIGLVNQVKEAEQEVVVMLEVGSIATPTPLYFDGEVFNWTRVGENMSYEYYIRASYDGGDYKEFHGTTTGNKVVLIDQGFPFKYGKFYANVYATDNNCGFSRVVGKDFTYEAPPTTEEGSIDLGTGGGSGGGTGGGGNTGGQDPPTGDNCYTNVSGPAFVKGKLTQLSDGKYKYDMTIKNFWNVPVDARMCVASTLEGGWNCGDARQIKPGATYTITPYHVKVEGTSGVRRIILFYPSSDAGSCHFPRPWN